MANEMKVDGSSAADVFAVGGGPAGLVTAIAACQKRLKVTLADGAAPPIDKPCGEGMMPDAQATLRKLGVDVPDELGYRFLGLQFLDEGGCAAADFPMGFGVGIRRPLLHGLLVEAAEKAGVQLLWKMPIRGIEGNAVHLRGGQLRARWIVGADGGGSRVRQWSDLADPLPVRRRYARGCETLQTREG